jgi:ribosomal protein S18 acetylase RimI-like enzyme
MTELIDPRALIRIPVTTPPPMQRYHARQPRVEAHDGFTLLDLGGPAPAVNFLTIYSEADPDQIVEHARAFFGNAGFAIGIEVDTAPAFEARLKEHGWRIDEEEPSMLLRPIPDIPPAPDGLDIRHVSTEADLDDFIRITKTGRRWIPSLAAARDPNVALFVGYVDGVPVATSRINVMGEIGDINGVETLPAYRRRGIGTALTWASVAAGKERGCTAITLSASPLGYPVYLKMGFQPVCVYRTYVRR